MNDTKNTETEYQLRLGRLLQLTKEQNFARQHQNCLAKTFDQNNRLVKCISCSQDEADAFELEDDLQNERFTDELQINICKICNSNEVGPLNEADICGNCTADAHVYDFEFGEAKEINPWQHPW